MSSILKTIKKEMMAFNFVFVSKKDLWNIFRQYIPVIFISVCYN